MTTVLMTTRDAYYMPIPGMPTHPENGEPTTPGNWGDQSVSQDGAGNLYTYLPADTPNPGDSEGWRDEGPYLGMEVGWYQNLPTPDVLGYDLNPTLCYEVDAVAGWMVISVDADPAVVQTWGVRLNIGDPMLTEAWNSDVLPPSIRGRVRDDLGLKNSDVQGLTAAEACKAYHRQDDRADVGHTHGQWVRDTGDGQPGLVRQVLFLESTDDILNREVPQGRSN